MAGLFDSLTEDEMNKLMASLGPDSRPSGNGLPAHITQQELDKAQVVDMRKVPVNQKLAPTAPPKPVRNISRAPAVMPEPEVPMPAAPSAAPAAMNPQVKDYLMKKFELGEYTDDARKKLVDENSKYDVGGRAQAALAALGAGFMGKDAGAAGNAVLDRQKADKNQKLSEFDKGRSGKIQEWALDRDVTKAGRDDEKYAQDQELLMRERDPNSQESKMAQDLAKAMGGYQGDPSKITAEQFKQFSPVMRMKYEIEQQKLNQQETRADKRDEKALAAETKATEKAKLSDKQTSELATHDKAIQALDDVLVQKSKWDTGKLSMGMNKVASWVGMDDSQKSAFKSDVGEQLASYIKAISGATVSPTERAALLENVPSVYDNDDTFVAKANALKKRLERNRDIEIDYLSKQGKNTENFKSEVNRGTRTAGASDKSAGPKPSWAK